MFHKVTPPVPRSLGFGFACGAFVGAALVATTMTLKPRFMASINRRKPSVGLLSGWLNISSSSKALAKVYHRYDLLSKLFHRTTKALAVPVITDFPPLFYPPRDALLFRGTDFPTLEPPSLHALSMNIPLPTLVSSPLPIASPQRSLLFHGSAFNSPAPALLANLSPISPLFDSHLTADATQLPGHFVDLLGDDDQLDSPATIRSTNHLVLSRQDVPAIVRGFGATLTIIDGGSRVQLMKVLSALATEAAHEQLPLTLVVEFKGDTSSASRTIQRIITNLNECLQCLAVYMPQDGDGCRKSFPHVEISQQLVHPSQSSILQHLVWRGNDISELFLQWGSVSDFPFHNLRTLSLVCELALDDCIQILFQCENLTSFSAWSLAEAESFMKHDFHDKVFYLRSLTIKSDVLLDKLFETLHMTQLDNIDLELGPDASPTEGIHTLAVEWSELRKVRLVGIPDSRCDGVEQRCVNAQLVQIETLPHL